MSDAGNMDLLRKQRDELRDEAIAGDPAGVARQRAQGKRTARDRLDLLLDPGSFTEIDMYRRHQAHGFKVGDNRPLTDGVVAGSGTIDGRRVFVYAQDFTIFGGSLGAAHAAKIHKVLDLALATGSPVIGLNDSGGARIQEGVLALDGYGGIFRRQVAASGIIPQINVLLGPCAGGAAYSPALSDFTFMVRGTAKMYLTGPDVVAAVTGERVSHDELGGADVHGRRSGVATFVHDDEESCLEDVRYLVSMLPANNLSGAPVPPRRDVVDEPRPRLADIVPAKPNLPYDIREVIAELVDDGDFLELHETWAANIVCVLARINDEVVGIVGNQPLVLAGVLDIEASQKAARFVRFCDAFGIPLVTLVDVPGFLPGTDQEYSGVIRHGAKLLYAYCEATVPRIQVILRKAYGGAYIVMDSRSIGCDLSLAWPTNEIAVMGAEGAVDVLFRKELAGAADPDALRVSLMDTYADELVHPFYAAERGLVDDVIDQADTRTAIASGLAMLREKRAQPAPRKHGNLPI
ncbi:Acetyl-CoA carboxylase, carboxyltransferase component [Saccharopolyspora antimicrobica]|uniref:Acetyl-CoA carboxylase carboxyltransferase component n=1 Tax=Saccharopolyspora antimicrobica TaxID=455193 RepID=A0A1I4VU06_9PSEU|nr:acyl-CoA carboxylase subunit beta [Saccharopolyspora antimicrobica]RKT87217.1 acetyl-CoA carboxylase carboxyltransferase component [Saccharopolyspora antimicrobica]SFN04497.1 Acetyl-CoA carboxylase, carboxyltransferase component [Saccharopolyspora antimicrobica]